jgi:hypothetical protein
MTFARKTEVPLVALKQRTASGMRALAGKIDEELPGMVAPQHLRDAARALESGNHVGAKRHLQAAMHTMTPLSLTRHGVLDDHGHSLAKVNMDLINRHHMLVSDLEDGENHNQGVRATPATFTQPSTLPLGGSMNSQQVRGAASDGGPGAPKTVRTAMVPAPRQNTGTDRAVAGGPKAPSRKENQLPARPTPQAVLSWADLYDLIELSTQTGRLAATPAPRGRPGGPGLYDVKGMGHTAYLQQIVKALIRKRGMPPDKAYAIARGAIRRWASGGGKVHPEVRAAATAAESGELARQRQAKSDHEHTADSWAGVFDLVGTAAGAALDPRTVTGQFGAGGQQPPPAAAPAASPAEKKRQLLAQAAADRQKARDLAKQLAVLVAASKATTKTTAQATKAGATGKTASSTPAKKAATAPAAQTAGAARKPTKKQQVAALKTQIAALLAKAAQETAQAAKL